METLLRVLCAALFAASPGCFFYDSRWAQHEEEKERAVARLRPATLERRGSRPSEARSASVRAYGTRAYASETLHWKAQFDKLLSDANAVLEPVLGLRLVNGGTTLWQPSAPEDQLDAVLAELAAFDRGDGVSWVVGFVQSTPKLVVDYHALGVGRVFSKYLVMRASNDPRELELLSKEYYGLSEAEKAKLHTERKRHRNLAVFLHEVGHTLGAHHRVDRRTLMSPMYHPEERGFDATTLGLLRVTVPLHLDSAPPDKTYRTALDYYTAHREGWVPSERDQVIERLSAILAQANARTASAGPRPTNSQTAAPPRTREAVRGLDSLSKDDRERYDRALEAEAQGDVRGAWRTLLPAVETNPRVREVQELRCRLAHKQRFIEMIIEAHCAPAAELGAGSRSPVDE